MRWARYLGDYTLASGSTLVQSNQRTFFNDTGTFNVMGIDIYNWIGAPGVRNNDRLYATFIKHMFNHGLPNRSPLRFFDIFASFIWTNLPVSNSALEDYYPILQPGDVGLDGDQPSVHTHSVRV
jgi:hypothetical protein